MSHYRTAGQQNGTTPVVLPDSEVRADGRRRTFTVEYKLRILAEADRSSEAGAIGALRREGLYSSHLTDWRRQRDMGELKSGVARVRGRKPRLPAQRIEHAVDRHRLVQGGDRHIGEQAAAVDKEGHEA